MEPILEAKGVNGAMALYEDRVVITRKGLLGFMTQGMKGSKEIPLSRITALQFKDSGMVLSGYLQLSVEGEMSSKGGIKDATKDENTVMFARQHKPEVWAQMRDEIRARSAATRQGGAAAAPAAPDSLDQLKKLAELRDAGIITEDEFSAKKAQLLSI